MDIFQLQKCIHIDAIDVKLYKHQNKMGQFGCNKIEHTLLANTLTSISTYTSNLFSTPKTKTGLKLRSIFTNQSSKSPCNNNMTIDGALADCISKESGDYRCDISFIGNESSFNKPGLDFDLVYWSILSSLSSLSI